MKYTIIQINDRSMENVEKSKKILENFDYIDDICFCDGSKVNVDNILDSLHIKNNWNAYPYEGVARAPLSGEFGIWISNLEIFNYIINNEISEMLVLEDDAILSKDFVDKLNVVLKEAPENYDFISLYSSSEENNEDETTAISLKYLHRSTNQGAGNVAMIYSYSGIKKFLDLVKENGIEYTIDCQIYNESRKYKLNGYSLKKEHQIVFHNNYLPSTVDPHGIRNKQHYFQSNRVNI